MPSSSSRKRSLSSTESNTKKPKETNEKKQKEENNEPTPPSAASHLTQADLLSLSYLSTFALSRSTWKFQKLRQSWCLTHWMDKAKMGKQYFLYFILYCKGMQGKARELLMEEARKMVELYQNEQQKKGNKDESEGEEDGEEQKRKKRMYQRAMKLLNELA